MITFQRLVVTLLAATVSLTLAACGSTASRNAVRSSGTPVNPFTDPGAADQPTAPLTGAQPQHR